MRTVWVAALGVLVLGAGSCAGRSEQRVDGTRAGGAGGAGGGESTTGGSGGSGASGGFGGTGGVGGTGAVGGKGGSGASGGKGGTGANGGKGGTGGTADGGTSPFGKAGASGGGLGGSAGDAGDTGSSGAAGESPCSCEATPLPRGDQMLTCAVPENALCCARAPVVCTSNLDEVLANVARDCTSSADGALSSCTDGTLELWYTNYDYDSDVRITFNSGGLAIGKLYNGSMCPEVYEGECHGSNQLDFAKYQWGDLAERTCEPYCELCENRRHDDAEFPRCTGP